MTPNDQHSNAIHTHSSTKVNWCGYDSMLHAKICSTNKIVSNPVLTAYPSKHNYNTQQNSATPVLNCNNNSNSNGNCNGYTNNNNSRASRSRHRHHNEFPISASPKVQGYTKLMSTQQNSKLNTAILNQLNPQLTQEQKLTQSITHVEKWLADDQIDAATSNIIMANNMLDMSKNVNLNLNCKNNNVHKGASECLNNMNNTDKFKGNEILTKKHNDVSSSSKKAFNKEILLTRKTPKSSLSSSLQNSSNSDSPGGKVGSIGATSNKAVAETKENIVEYASIPIVDPSHSECENLLRASSDENESNSQIGITDNASLSTTIHHRYVHIHHHYYHH